MNGDLEMNEAREYMTKVIDDLSTRATKIHVAVNLGGMPDGRDGSSDDIRKEKLLVGKSEVVMIVGLTFQQDMVMLPCQ